MTAYYNENDPVAADVLQRLIIDGVIAPGDIDTRSIKDVKPHEVYGYTQCHFFAGGGLWSVAARLAGWPDDKPLWTGSCPCQPFSQAGQGRGVADERHLWPDFYRLIKANRPPVIVGEQVAGAAGYGWLDGVSADLAGENYTSGAVDIPSCAVDAPHIRQRLYWVAVADAEREGQQGQLRELGGMAAPGGQRPPDQSQRRNETHGDGELVVPESNGRGARRPEHEVWQWRPTVASTDAPSRAMGDAIDTGLERQPRHGDGAPGRTEPDRPVAEADGGDVAHANLQRRGEAGKLRQGEVAEFGGRSGVNRSFWADHEWLICHDGKARRTKPGLRLLVDGLPGRVGLWRIAGNAINPVLAAEVLKALMETTHDAQ